jgi:hypothetical protein
VITKNIVPENFRMEMGNKVLFGVDPENYPVPKFDKEGIVRVEEHTIERIIKCFDQLKVQPPVGYSNVGGLDAMGIFCGYLMLDVLISNQDRHHENWAILINAESGVRTLCPSYDHAASLGRELLDDDRDRKLKTKDKNQTVAIFVGKAKSLFYDESGKKPLSGIEAFFSAVESRAAAKAHWLAALEKISLDEMNAIFGKIPEGVISEHAQAFAIAMILENKKRLLNYGNE